jgi:hypothetical protein
MHPCTVLKILLYFAFIYNVYVCMYSIFTLLYINKYSKLYKIQVHINF